MLSIQKATYVLSRDIVHKREIEAKTVRQSMRGKEMYTKEFHSLDLNLLFCWDFGKCIFSSYVEVFLCLLASMTESFQIGSFYRLATKRESLRQSSKEYAIAS